MAIATNRAASQASGSIPPSPGVRTGSTTINAAFLQEIKEDNRQLKELIDSARSLTVHPLTAVNHFDDLKAILGDLRDQVAMHFTLEEAYGYFDDALDTCPHLSIEAVALRSQHSGLFVMVRDLADQIAATSSSDTDAVQRLCQRFDAFDRALQVHESDELRLILSAIDDDIGVGD